MNLGALILFLVIAAQVGATLSESWTTLVLWWYAPHSATLDPIFGKSLGFYLFQLPAWELLTGWLTTLAAIVCAVAAVFVGLTATARALTRQRIVATLERPWRGLAVAVAALLVTIAAQVYFGRFDRLFDDHTIFSGVDYTQAHITLAGLLVVCGALLGGAAIALTAAVRMPRLPWIAGSVVPAVVCYIAVQLVAWYMSTLIVRPNQLTRKRPYIAHNIALTRRAYGLDGSRSILSPADVGIAAVDPSQNQTTLDNIRLWDWRRCRMGCGRSRRSVLTTTSPRSTSTGTSGGAPARDGARGARAKHGEASGEQPDLDQREAYYTHGYGVAMTSVNGFTPEGLPQLF